MKGHRKVFKIIVTLEFRKNHLNWNYQWGSWKNFSFTFFFQTIFKENFSLEFFKLKNEIKIFPKKISEEFEKSIQVFSQFLQQASSCKRIKKKKVQN